MKHSKSIIHILLFITIQISQFCQAQTCLKVRPMESSGSDGFECLLYENQNQLELLNMHEYLLAYVGGSVPGKRSSSFVTDPNFELDVSNDGSDNTGTLFGQSINISNFTIGYSGGFVPKITGYHTFKISTDDAAMLAILTSFDFFCCDDMTDNINSTKWYMDIYQNHASIIEYTGSPDDTSEVSLYLTAGEPVAMQMSYVNRAGSARFNLTVTDPDNVSFTDLSGYIFESFFPVYCYDEVDILEPASVLSSTTYSTDFITASINTVFPADVTM